VLPIPNSDGIFAETIFPLSSSPILILEKEEKDGAGKEEHN